MDAHAVFDDSLESGDRAPQIAWVSPAARDDVSTMLCQNVGDLDGRSDWVWVRLSDGTLMLATFPRGDLYMEMSDKGVCDWQDGERG